MPEELTRTFVAVELDPGLREAVRAVQEDLASAGGRMRWVHPENLHLTLRFLDTLPRGRMEAAIAAAGQAASEVRPFQVTFRAVGAFPSPRRAQVVWIGVGEGAERLVALAVSLDAAMARHGFGEPDRPFRPHLTIGRAGNAPGPLWRALEAVGEVEVGSQVVTHIAVVASVLGPGGPRYAVLDRAPLGRLG